MSESEEEIFVHQERLEDFDSIYGDLARYTAGWASVIVCSTMTVFLFAVLIHEFMFYKGNAILGALYAEWEAGTLHFCKKKMKFSEDWGRGIRRKTKKIDGEKDEDEDDEGDGRKVTVHGENSSEMEVPDTMGISTKGGLDVSSKRMTGTVEAGDTSTRGLDLSTRGINATTSESTITMSGRR